MFKTLYKWKLKLRREAAVRKAGRLRDRADSSRPEQAPGPETCGAVRGVARRVVIVREPDPEIFEEAIFVVREDYAGVGRSELLQEARKAAGGYIGSALGTSGRMPRWVRAAAYLLSGAGAAGLIWLALHFLAAA